VTLLGRHENYDEALRLQLAIRPNTAIPWILMASYLYYHHDQALLSDGFFDTLCQTVAAYWDFFQHRHKHLISPADLQAGSLYRLQPEDYPTITRDTAHHLARSLI